MKNLQKMLCALILGLAIIGNLNAMESVSSEIELFNTDEATTEENDKIFSDSDDDDESNPNEEGKKKPHSDEMKTGPIKTGNTGRGPEEDKEKYKEKQKENVPKKIDKKKKNDISQDVAREKQNANKPKNARQLELQKAQLLALVSVDLKARKLDHLIEEEKPAEEVEEVMAKKNGNKEKESELAPEFNPGKQALDNASQKAQNLIKEEAKKQKQIEDLQDLIKDSSSYRIGTRAYGTALAGLSGAAFYTCIKNLIQEGTSLKNISALLFALPLILSTSLLIYPHNAKARAIMATLSFIVIMGANIYINGYMDNN